LTLGEQHGDRGRVQLKGNHKISHLYNTGLKNKKRFRVDSLRMAEGISIGLGGDNLGSRAAWYSGIEYYIIEAKSGCEKGLSVSTR
jgi:hypothetical protein